MDLLCRPPSESFDRIDIYVLGNVYINLLRSVCDSVGTFIGI